MLPHAWNVVAGTRDVAGTDINLYVNGLNVGNGTLTAADGGSSSVLFMMEFPSGTSAFDESLQSVAIYDTELTPAQIQELTRSVGLFPAGYG